MVNTLCVVKAVDSFQSFSNTIGRRSINELCLASLLCDHASALSESRTLTIDSSKQTSMFRLNPSLTAQMFNNEVYEWPPRAKLQNTGPLLTIHPTRELV